MGRTRGLHTEAATVASTRTPTVAAIARVDTSATIATPSGVATARAGRAHARARQSMSRGSVASWIVGSVRLGMSSAPGMRPGSASTTNGAATTAIPKEIDD